LEIQITCQNHDKNGVEKLCTKMKRNKEKIKQKPEKHKNTQKNKIQKQQSKIWKAHRARLFILIRKYPTY
jgi:transposase